MQDTPTIGNLVGVFGVFEVLQFEKSPPGELGGLSVSDGW